MKFICPVTNVVVTCDTIFTSSKTAVSSLHPLLSLPLTQLNKLNHNDNRHHKVSDYETQLLFCAYLYRTGLVSYTQPLPPKSIPVEFCRRWFSLVHTVANSSKAKDKNKYAPHFRVSEQFDFMSFKNFIHLLHEFITYGSVSSGEESTTDITEELMEELEARKKQRRQAKLLKQNRENSLKQLKLWALLHLKDSESLELVTTVFEKSEKFGIQALKKVRHSCLVELPESNPTDTAKKDEIIEWLTSVTLKKLELNRVLAMDEDEIAEINAELIEIENSYKILHKGEEVINSAIPGACKVTELLGMDVKATEAAPSIPAPTSYPQREDYANAMAYKVALRKFHEGNDKL